MTDIGDAFSRYGLIKNPREAELLNEGLWQGKLLVDYLDEHAQVTPKKPAYVEAHRVLTFSDVQKQSQNLAAGLIALGIETGDVVAVQSPNWTELPISHLALDRIGGIFLPIHDGFRDAELLHLLKSSRARAIIMPAIFRGYDHRSLLQTLRIDLPDLEHVILMRATPEKDEIKFETLSNDSSWIDRHGSNYLDQFRPQSTDPLLVMVSSGTTGMPRCSAFPDESCAIRTVRHFGAAGQVTASDIAGAIAPAGTGATGYVFPVLAPILHGATGVLLERWSGRDADAALDMIEHNGCTYIAVIPTQLVKLVDAAKRGVSRDYSRLRFIIYAGAKLAESIAIEAERIFGCPVISVYGATENSSLSMTSIDDDDEHRRSVGRVLEGVEAKIVDDDQKLVPDGATGEICWRGATSSYGFLDDPEANRARELSGGWHYSGDLGQFDLEGYLHIVGRKKDMIIRGGRNINPGKIEEILLGNSLVLDVALVPSPDAVLGEIICAVVIPSNPAAPPTLDDLNATIREAGMALWYQPERLVVVDDFPRNAGGKTDKRALTAMISTATQV